MGVGKRIADQRSKNGWTQSELAWRSGILRSELSQLECGGGSSTALNKVANALGISPSHLAGHRVG
ncbi:TPA: helix-turn-helix transcriptional regulator [Vibrio harveyi]|nr:helix-turn-helix transcriptional regulator [Vibrio harveyi]